MDHSALFDLHTHLGSHLSCPQIICATQESEWTNILHLSLKNPTRYYPALGIHPWYAHTATSKWKKTLLSLIGQSPQASLGEIGLDQSPKFKGNFQIQLTLFKEQYFLAQELKKPITLHCVKAWDILIPFLEKNPPKSALLHSFYASHEIIRALSNLSLFFSFSPKQLSFPRLESIVKAIPKKSLCLESDGSSDQDFLFLHKEIARILKVKEEDLEIMNRDHALNFLNI